MSSVKKSFMDITLDFWENFFLIAPNSHDAHILKAVTFKIYYIFTFLSFSFFFFKNISTHSFLINSLPFQYLKPKKDGFCDRSKNFTLIATAINFEIVHFFLLSGRITSHISHFELDFL